MSWAFPLLGTSGQPLALQQLLGPRDSAKDGPQLTMLTSQSREEHQGVSTDNLISAWSILISQQRHLVGDETQNMGAAMGSGGGMRECFHK